MIKKLQIKFVLIATVAVLVVLGAFTGLVNSVMYQRTLDDVYETAAFIADNGGVMPNDIKKIENNTRDFSEEDKYRVRYFTIVLDEDNEIESTNLNRIALVTDSELDSFVNEVINNNFKNGRVTYNDCEYVFCTSEKSSSKVVVFLDATNEIEMAEEFRESSYTFGVICLLFFVFFVSVFSKKAIQPIINNMESQKQFITNASHELKTPLAVISANTEVIEMTNGETEWTRSIINQVNRLNNLIAKLITLSKFGEIDKSELYEVDVTKIVSDCVNDFKPVFVQNNKHFSAEIASGVHAKGTNDGFKEITNILLDNAAKYCDDGGEVNLFLSQRTSAKGVKLVVSNSYKNGDIEPKRFFERFYREDESHNSDKSGYGIGLAMAQGFAEEFGGKISVSYKDGVITFTVTI